MNDDAASATNAWIRHASLCRSSFSESCRRGTFRTLLEAHQYGDFGADRFDRCARICPAYREAEAADTRWGYDMVVSDGRQKQRASLTHVPTSQAKTCSVGGIPLLFLLKIQTEVMEVIPVFPETVLRVPVDVLANLFPESVG